MSNRPLKVTPIALDIGLTGVRAMQLKRSNHTWRVLHAARCERTLDAADEARAGLSG